MPFDRFEHMSPFKFTLQEFANTQGSFDVQVQGGVLKDGQQQEGILIMFDQTLDFCFTPSHIGE